MNQKDIETFAAVHDVSIKDAESFLAEFRTRENAKLAGMVVDWDEAYAIAFDAYKGERRFEVQS